jgi:hypothetical protein
MQSLFVVVALDEPRNVCPEILKVRVFLRFHVFSLQRSEETLTVAGVTRSARSADTRDHAVLAQESDVTRMNVLLPAI